LPSLVVVAVSRVGVPGFAVEDAEELDPERSFARPAFPDAQLEAHVLERLAVGKLEVGRSRHDRGVSGQAGDLLDGRLDGGEGDAEGDGLVRHLAEERARRLHVGIDPQAEGACLHRLLVQGELRDPVTDHPSTRRDDLGEPSAGHDVPEPHGSGDAEGSHAGQGHEARPEMAGKSHSTPFDGDEFRSGSSTL
jgi:hypothetical protein